LRAAGALACFDFACENALGREDLGPCANAHSALDSSASQDNFVLPFWRIFAADFVVTLRAQARTILSALRQSFGMPKQLS